MVTSATESLTCELMDVVRLFEGASALGISHTFAVRGEEFYNRFIIDGEEFAFTDWERYAGETEKKSLVKRFAKLGLYKLLAKRYKKTLPWGSLTGIRPTRLAYQNLEKKGEFEEFFRTLGVSEENIALTKRVIAGQRGIYEKNPDNCDLFVSLPFCPTKCVYCSFITAPIAATHGYMPAYLSALEKELAAAAGQIKRLRSVYIGGGTPFVLSPEELERVFRAVAPLRQNGCEYTVEAGRPDTFCAEKLDLCQKYGVTRLCINAQSFSDRTLEAIGRKHTGEDVVRAFGMARPYEFDLNCDLIAGLTGESLEEFCASVDRAVELSPENITVHTLCLKKGARLKEETESLFEGGMSEMIAYSRKKLTAAGYEPYYLYRQKYMAGSHENVGWTKAGKACVYNVDVMEETCDNLAVGANAISKKIFSAEGRIERVGSPKDIPTYLAKVDKLLAEKEKIGFGETLC